MSSPNRTESTGNSTSSGTEEELQEQKQTESKRNTTSLFISKKFFETGDDFKQLVGGEFRQGPRVEEGSDRSVLAPKDRDLVKPPVNPARDKMKGRVQSGRVLSGAPALDEFRHQTAGSAGETFP